MWVLDEGVETPTVSTWHLPGRRRVYILTKRHLQADQLPFTHV